MLEADELLRHAPLRREGLLGGAHIETDLQTDPRTAAAAIVRHLAALGVEFRFRTAVIALGAGRVDTTRGTLRCANVVVAVNHDIDQLLPEVAERHGVVRCALDMMRAAVTFRHPLAAPCSPAGRWCATGGSTGRRPPPSASDCTPSALTSPPSI